MLRRKTERTHTGRRLLIGVVAAAVICLGLEWIARLCDWHSDNQRVVLNFGENSILILWVLWALRKRLIKGVIAYLVVFFGLAAVLVLATIGMALTAPLIPDAFGTETDFIVYQCKPDDDAYVCTGTTTESPPRTGYVTLDGPHAHGDTVHGTFYGGPFGGFAENSPAPPHPAVLPSMLAATALLVVIACVVRYLARAIRAPADAPIWEPEASVLIKPRVGALFRRIGLVGMVIATAVSGYLFIEQLGTTSATEVATIFALSVGDWMNVAGVMIGLVAWGYRKVETPFGKRVVAVSSKVSLFGLLFTIAIFVVLQSQAIAKPFIVTAWPFVWDAIQYADNLQRGFTVPMMLASAALLLTAHLLTLQFAEADKAIGHQAGCRSVLVPEAQELINFLAPFPNGCKRTQLDRLFSGSALLLAELQRIGLVAQSKKKQRLTAKGREAMSTGTAAA